jgi:hypothetical protein
MRLFPPDHQVVQYISIGEQVEMSGTVTHNMLKYN